MIDEEAAVALAKGFLQGSPGGDGPFSVRAEQDFWVVSAPGENGDTIMVFVDVEDGKPCYYREEVVDVELRKEW